MNLARCRYMLLLLLFLWHGLDSFSQPRLKNYRLVLNQEFNELPSSKVIDETVWQRTPDWNQGTNTTGSMSWCIKTEDTLWDKAYLIRNNSDTSTIRVSNGTCKLLTDSADYYGEIWNWPQGIFTVDTLMYNYRTGALYSKQQFKYGYFEIKFRLPAPPEPPLSHQGFGPNFWLFGSDKPNNVWWSEIDIFEINAYSPKDGSNVYTSNIHYSEKDTGWHPTHYNMLGNISSSDWHIASCIWTNRFIKIYLNGKLINKVRRTRTFPVDKMAPMNLIVDINSPASNFCTNFDPQTTAFPYVYEIDYIKVYQK